MSPALPPIALDAKPEVPRETHPLIVLIGGGTGVGSSTVAMALGAALVQGSDDHTRRKISVIGTDYIREVMRSTSPASGADEGGSRKSEWSPLSLSTYEQYKSMRFLNHLQLSHETMVIAGYRMQAQLLSAGVYGVIKRSIEEGYDLIVEGVHLLHEFLHPELVSRVKEVVIDVEEPELLRQRLILRAQRSGRDASRPLASLEEIWLIKEHIVEAADDAGIPVVSNGRDRVTGQEKTVGQVVEECARRLDLTIPAVSPLDREVEA